MLFETYRTQIIVVFEQCQLYAEAFEYFELRRSARNNRSGKSMRQIRSFESCTQRERERKKHMYRDANVAFFIPQPKR